MRHKFPMLWKPKNLCDLLDYNIHFIVVVNPWYCQDMPILSILPNGLLFFFFGSAYCIWHHSVWTQSIGCNSSIDSHEMHVPNLISHSLIFRPFNCFSELLKNAALDRPEHLCVCISVYLQDRFFIQNFHRRLKLWNEFHYELCVLINAVLPNAENHFNQRLGEKLL